MMVVVAAKAEGGVVFVVSGSSDGGCSDNGRRNRNIESHGNEQLYVHGCCRTTCNKMIHSTVWNEKRYCSTIIRIISWCIL
jgi:hypothetical protein